MHHRLQKKSWQDRRYFGYCVLCGSRFQSWLPYDHNRESIFQAYNCASYLYLDKENNQTLLFGSYGSCYDTEKFFVSDNIEFTDGAVCDGCIETGIEAKNFIQDEDFNYWHAVRAELESRGIPQLSVEDCEMLIEQLKNDMLP